MSDYSQSGDSDNEEPLPPGWVQSVDQRTGRTYYYHRTTRKTTWKRPVAEEAPPKPAAAVPAVVVSQSASSLGASASSATLKKRAKTGRKSPDGKWEEIEDQISNKKYWYNKDTKATAWVLPESAMQLEEPEEVESVDELQQLPSVEKGAPLDFGSSANLVENKIDASPTEVAISAIPVENKPAAQMVKIKQAINQQESQLLAAGVNDDDDDVYEFAFSQQRSGWFSQLFGNGDVQQDDELLAFSSEMISKALLKKNRALDDDCLRVFRSVLSYMGDRKTSKSEFHHAKLIIRTALDRTAPFRDEVFLQLCKQTTRNPRVESTVKGWELMAFCLASFGPSKEFRKYLIQYFNNAQEDPIPKVQSFANECLHRLEKIVKLGSRRQVPSTTEMRHMQMQKPITLHIHFLNTTYQPVQVDAYTFVRDVFESVAIKINLSFRIPFALYENDINNPYDERLLDPKDRILDILSTHEIDIPETKSTFGFTLSRSSSQPQISTYNQFVFKARLMLKTTDAEVMADPEAINLFYLQMVHDVVFFRVPVNDRDIAVLAALQLQATYSDYQPDVHDGEWLEPKLRDCIPHYLVAIEGEAEALMGEWKDKILEKYSKIQGFTSLEAKLNYLDYVQEWPFYGVTLSWAEQRQFKDYPSPIFIGVTSDSILLVHPQKKTVLERWPYADVVTWGYSKDRFIFVVGNAVQQRKLIFKTLTGVVVNNLIHEYVKYTMSKLREQ